MSLKRQLVPYLFALLNLTLLIYKRKKNLTRQNQNISMLKPYVFVSVFQSKLIYTACIFVYSVQSSHVSYRPATTWKTCPTSSKTPKARNPRSSGPRRWQRNRKELVFAFHMFLTRLFGFAVFLIWI